MMWLTRARLRQGGGQGGAVAAQLAKASERDQGHALIWSLMNKDSPARDFVFRQTDLSPPSYLILSARAPEDTLGLWSLETKPFAPNIADGGRFSFSLRVSPAIRKGRGAPPTEKGKKVASKRVDILMDAKLQAKATGALFDDPEIVRQTALAWLEPRATRAGFALRDDLARVSGYRQINLGKGADDKGDRRFSVLDIDGVLTVTDAEAFRTALCAGIGPQKSYGCGLLLIRPA